MKKIFILGALLTFNLVAPITTTENVLAEVNNSDTIKTEDILAEANSDSEFPVVDASQWRNGKFKFPWSKPVIVDDDFDGKYLAVLDRKRNRGLGMGAEAGIVSEWSKNKIKVNFYYSVQQLFGKPRMTIGYAEKIELRVGDSTFRLEGDRGIFDVTDDMIQAFANAKEPAKMKIYPSEHEGNEYFTAINDEAVIDIKQETVDAWNVVYGSQEVASE